MQARQLLPAQPPPVAPTVAIYENAWQMTGMEKLLSDFILAPEQAAFVLDRITETREARRGGAIYYVDLGVREGMTLENAITEAKSLDARHKEAGLDQPALDQAAQSGFSNASNLAGGIMAWEQANLPISRK